MISFQIDDLQLITGIDIPVQELGLTIRQPKVKEIAMLGEAQYFTALSIFTMTTKQLKINIPDATNWMLFQQTLSQKIEGISNVRSLLSNFLQLFFIPKVVIGPNSILLNNPKDESFISIEPNQFDDLQSIIHAVGGADLLKPSEEQEFKPGNKLAAQIAEKMKKGRARIAAMQPQAKHEGFLAKYIRAVAIATPNSLSEVNDMTMLQLNTLMQTYINYEQYDLEVRSRLAGAKGEDKLTHWITRPLGGNNENSSVGKLENMKTD